MSRVYVAECLISGKAYVGKTTKSLKKRKIEHEKATKRGAVQLFNKALRKYGFDAFEWKVLIEEDDEQVLDQMERHYIKQLGTKVPGGYNLTDGGEGLLNPSVSVRKKMSIAHKGRTYTLGLRHSEETKAKMSAAGLGRIVSKETRAKISANSRGWHHTDEAKRKISLALSKRCPSEETKRKISLANRGKIISPQWRSRISQGLKNSKRFQTVIRSEEHKAKISKACKGKNRYKKTAEHRTKISNALMGQKRGPLSEETKMKMRASQKKRRDREHLRCIM